MVVSGLSARVGFLCVGLLGLGALAFYGNVCASQPSFDEPEQPGEWTPSSFRAPHREVHERDADQEKEGAQPSLDDILAKSGSDKAKPGRNKGYHGYTRHYEVLFEQFRHRRVRLLEIGVENGRSLKAWQQYFTNADHIYGIGYGNFQKAPSQSCGDAKNTRVSSSQTACTLFHGDQSDVGFLNHFLQESEGQFDVIIDDGSHVPTHQIVSFEHLWKSVKPGGLYIIEDIETNWWSPSSTVYGYSLRNQPSVVEKWKGVIDSVNREFTHGTSRLTDERPDLYKNIVSVEFGQNIIIFRKSLANEEEFLARRYRFSHKLR